VRGGTPEPAGAAPAAEAARLPLASAFARLEAACERRAEEIVERVEADPAETRLELAVRAGGHQRWFTWRAGELAERHPADDERVPLAAELVGSARARTSVLSWRPGRRIVLAPEALWADGRGTLRKGFRRSRWREALARQEHAARACARAGLAAARVAGAIESRAAFELERVAGTPLSYSLAGAEHFARVGAALAALQEQDCPFPVHDLAAELAVLDAWRARVHWARGELPRGWDAARARLERRAGALGRATAVLCHRDLHDGQILVGERSVALLDFDLLCRADPALDPANLLVHLALRGLQGQKGESETNVRACAEALLEGYDRCDAPGFWPRLRAWQAASALRLALVYDLRPRWSALAPRLVEFAGDWLDESEAA
jgi:hypothetical protein